jgi:hypothetical protein
MQTEVAEGLRGRCGVHAAQCPAPGSVTSPLLFGRRCASAM